MEHVSLEDLENDLAGELDSLHREYCQDEVNKNTDVSFHLSTQDM